MQAYNAQAAVDAEAQVAFITHELGRAAVN